VLGKSQSYLPQDNQEPKSSASPPDFQVEAEEDIRTETNGILQDLLLALSKVRLGLKGICVPQLRMGQTRELCCPVTDRESFGEARV
jgi:hypothetical protein